jgi:hypothetical protein
MVLDKSGHIMQDVIVNFVVTAGAASLSPTSAPTDSTGEAKTMVTLGSPLGATTIDAQVVGLPPVEFTVVGTGTPSELATTAGNHQQGLPGATLPRPLTVEVDDSLGDPVAGVAITFQVLAGGGSLSTGSATTDAHGLATTSLTLGPAPGTNKVAATAENMTAIFSETALAGTTTTLELTSGNGQTGAVGTTLAAPLCVTVLDQAGNPVAGASVTFSVLGGGGTVSAPTATTSSSGQATTGWTLGPAAGTNAVNASIGGAAPVVFTATATAGSIASVTISSGNNQTGPVGTTLPAPLVVLVKDASGNPVPQVAVAFAVITGAGTVSPVSTATDATGQASTNLTLGTLAGGLVVRASTSGGSTTFGASVVAGPAAQLSFANAPAHAAAGMVLSPAVLVHVTDSFGNVVTQATNPVTVALASNPSGGTLSGAAVVPAVGGAATFSSLQVNQSGTGYVLQASSAGLASASSAPFVVGLGSGPPGWLPGTDLSVARSRLAAVTASDGTTYALGGFATTVLGTAEMLAPVATSWQPLASLTTPRAGLAAAPGGSGRVYTLGGELANGAVTAASEVYDPSTGAWQSTPGLPTARSGLGAAASGAIYAVGGQDANGTPLGALEAYSESANAWQSLAPMLTARTRLGVAFGADGLLYAIGGATTQGASAVVEVYDPSLNAWSTVARLATAREGLAAALGPDGRIYAIGGRDAAGNFLASVEAYTAATDTWTTVANLLQARADLALAPRLPGQLLAAGGTITTGTSARVDAYGPTATLSPAVGAPGTSVSFQTTNLAPGANVSVFWGTASGTLLVQGVSDASGACSLSFTVPAATSGPQVVTVIDDRASYPVTVAFTVP